MEIMEMTKKWTSEYFYNENSSILVHHGESLFEFIRNGRDLIKELREDEPILTFFLHHLFGLLSWKSRISHSERDYRCIL